MLHWIAIILGIIFALFQLFYAFIEAGHLEKFFPDIEARIACGGSFVPIDAGKVIEDLGGYGSYPQDWLANVVRRPAARRKAGYDL